MMSVPRTRATFPRGPDDREFRAGERVPADVLRCPDGVVATFVVDVVVQPNPGGGCDVYPVYLMTQPTMAYLDRSGVEGPVLCYGAPTQWHRMPDSAWVAFLPRFGAEVEDHPYIVVGPRFADDGTPIPPPTDRTLTADVVVLHADA